MKYFLLAAGLLIALPAPVSCQTTGTAVTVAAREKATAYIIEVIRTSAAAGGRFTGLKGTLRRTDPDGTGIYNIKGLVSPGATTQYLMHKDNDFTTFVAEFTGASCEAMVAAITSGLAADTRSGTFGYRKLTANAAPGTNKYAITKDGKAVGIFQHKTEPGTGMLVVNAEK